MLLIFEKSIELENEMYQIEYSNKKSFREFLGIPVVKTELPPQGMQVPSLVQGTTSHMWWCSMVKKKVF